MPCSADSIALGRHQLASFGAFRALDVDGRRSLHALLHGGSGASDIWRVYRDWGYASAFGEAACSDAGARASGLGLRDEAAAGAAAERRRGLTTCCSSRFVASTRSCARNGGRRRQRERAER